MEAAIQNLTQDWVQLGLYSSRRITMATSQYQEPDEWRNECDGRCPSRVGLDYKDPSLKMGFFIFQNREG